MALSALSALALITIFIFVEGVPLIAKVGFFNFIFGMKWAPTLGQYGIFPMIVGTVLVTLGAIILGVPVALCCSIFLAEFAPRKLSNLVRPAIQLLAGIPSVVFGFWGLIFIVPAIRNYLGGPGLSILAGSIILAIMILPTIISISEVSLLSLPPLLKEGAFALGATHWQTIRSVLVPAAKSGILASIILGIGRAVGETMAVLMVTGNAAVIPHSFLQPVRTIPATIAAELGEAPVGGLHYKALFALGIVLFIITFGINMTVELLKAKSRKV